MRPSGPVVVASFAEVAPRVSPEHVTVTAPAARAEVTVNVIALLAKVDVVVIEEGGDIPHLSFA